MDLFEQIHRSGVIGIHRFYELEEELEELLRLKIDDEEADDYEYNMWQLEDHYEEMVASYLYYYNELADLAPRTPGITREIRDAREIHAYHRSKQDRKEHMTMSEYFVVCERFVKQVEEDHTALYREAIDEVRPRIRRNNT